MQQDFDIHKVLRSRYSIPPWENGKAKIAPDGLLHLAALALLGEVGILLFYSKRFIIGDRMGFDETIQEIHLERAVILAKEVEKEAQLSYALLQKAAEKMAMKVGSYQYFRAGDLELCRKKRDDYRKACEEKKQSLRKQGFIVSDEPVIYKVEGRKYYHDILYIKNGVPAFLDIKVG
ncbi:hypothetical protein K3248_07795 [Candidatus Bartonella raoultii]|uniref:Uncharacterized protein n=1 Tax=Bartonella raoultii TaxID=1457020 RepID=A0ABS7IA96_9HYPH|nr:hypothetical protein [Bartonella raoultii]